MSEPTPGSEATRKLVDQRRAGVPVDVPDQPKSAVADAEATLRRTEHHELTHPWWEGPDTPYATPSWVGPDRHPDRPTPGGPAIPAQVAPTHDRLEVTPPPTHAAEGVPLEAHWKGARLGRRTLGTVLAVALGATVVTGALTVVEHSGDLLNLFGVCALATVGTWGLLGSVRPMRVDLRGPMLTVHHHNLSETFDLSHPFQVVHMRGSASSRKWSLTLVRDDGTDLVIGPRTVAPREMQPIVAHYRGRAEERLRERKRRFTI